MEVIESDISCLRDEVEEMEEAVGRRVKQRRQEYRNFIVKPFLTQDVMLVVN